MTEPSTSRSAIRVERFSNLTFVPRFEYGHMAELAEICGEKDGTLLGTGLVRLKKARIPWTINYDEVLTVIEGSMKIYANHTVHELAALDSIWLPAGSELVYEAENALVSYAIHPNS